MSWFTEDLKKAATLNIDRKDMEIARKDALKSLNKAVNGKKKLAFNFFEIDWSKPSILRETFK